MEGESGINRSFIDEPHSSSGRLKHGVTGSISAELHSSKIQEDQMEGDGCVTGSIIDEVHSWDI